MDDIMLPTESSIEPNVKAALSRSYGFTHDEEEVVEWIGQQNPDDYYLTADGRVYNRVKDIELGKLIHFHLRLRGGKGGFGSILRSFRIHRSTNQNMCRTLSGRRLADVKEEERLKRWIEKKAERDKAKEAKKKEKLDRLRSGGPKHQFTDQTYLRRRDLVLDQVEDAFEAGIQAQAEKDLAGGSASELAPLRENGKGTPAAMMDGVEGDADSDTTTSSSDSEQEKEGEESEELDGRVSNGEATSSSSLARKHKRRRQTVPRARPTKQEKMEYTVDAIYHYYLEEFIGDLAETLLVELAKSESLATETANTSEVSTPSLTRDASKTQRHANHSAPVEASQEGKSETEVKDYPPIDLDLFTSANELEKLGMAHLKHALEVRGMKCGGALPERALRLLSVRGLRQEQYPKSVLRK